MILNSRRWRLLLRSLTLLVTTLLILAFAGPASYALQDDSPKPLTDTRQLADKHKPISGTYANVAAVPDLEHSLTTRSLVTTYYWIPLEGYGNHLILRTEDSQYLFPYDYSESGGAADVRSMQYAGKVLPLKEQADAEEVVDSLRAQGISIDRDTAMVLSQGEAPQIYRPVVPVIPVLAWIWLVALVGLIQIWRGKRSGRAATSARLAPRQIR